MFRSRSKSKLAVLCGWLGLVLFCRVDPTGSGKDCWAAQTEPAKPRPVRVIGPYLSREDVGHYTKVVLKNGLTVLLFERSDTPLVAMVTYVKAGRLHQGDSRKGFSRLWPPLLFRSLVPGREGTVAREARRWGAVIDAEMGHDHAWFSSVLPAEEYRRGLDLHLTVLGDLSPSSVTLEQVRQTARQQTALRGADPEQVSRRQLFQLAFQDGRVLADESGIGDGFPLMDREQIRRFHSQWFVPGNTCLTVTGNFDRRALLREVVKRYQSIPGRPVPDLPSYPQSGEDGFRYENRQGDIHQAWVRIGYPLPAAFSQDWYACKVLEAVLTAGETALMNRHFLRFESPVHAVSSSTMALDGLGYLNLTLSLDGAGLDRAEVITFAGIERVKEGFLTESDLRRARTLLEAEYHRGQESLVDLAIQLARYDHLAGFDAWSKTLQRIRSVTRQEVIAAAGRYLDLDRCTLVEYQPASEERRTFISASYREFLRLALARFIRELGQDGAIEVPLPEETEQAEFRPTRLKDPREISTAGLVSPLRKFSILRGPDVWVKEGRGLPLTAMGIFFPGGRLFESHENRGITELMAATAIRAGRSSLGSHPVRFFESLGVVLQVVVQADFFGFVLHGLSKNFGSCVDTLVGTLQGPHFEEEAIMAQKLALRLRAAARLDDPRHQAERLFLQAAYGDHPYGRAAYAASGSLHGITRQQLVEWHRRYVRGSRPVVVIAGDVEGSTFAARFATKWSRSGISLVDFDAAGRVRRLTVPRYKQGQAGKNQQWHAQAGFLGPPARDPRLTVFTVLQHLTSGARGSLPLALQNLQGGVGTVVTSHRRRELGGFFYAYLATASPNGQRALDELKAHLTRLAGGPPTEEEIDQAKKVAVRTYQVAMQHRTQQILELAERAIFGESIYEINNHLKRIEAVNREVVSEVVQEFFKPELWIAGVVSGPVP